jgi:hypothetical protein
MRTVAAGALTFVMALASPGQEWTVPIGGGFGRIFKIGDQPVSANVAGYYNVIRPDGTIRTELTLLFPEK